MKNPSVRGRLLSSWSRSCHGWCQSHECTRVQQSHVSASLLSLDGGGGAWEKACCPAYLAETRHNAPGWRGVEETQWRAQDATKQGVMHACGCTHSKHHNDQRSNERERGRSNSSHRVQHLQGMSSTQRRRQQQPSTAKQHSVMGMRACAESFFFTIVKAQCIYPPCKTPCHGPGNPDPGSTATQHTVLPTQRTVM